MVQPVAPAPLEPVGDPSARRRWTLFAVLALLAVGSLGLAVWREETPEWATAQRAFIARERAAARAAVARAVDPGDKARAERALRAAEAQRVELSQIYLEKLNRIDRCVTCHQGIGDARWRDARQPFRTHSEPFLGDHPAERFACTSCHRGQGLATTASAAHAASDSWKDPLLPAVYLEAACGGCHRGSVWRAAPVLARGREVFARLGCAGCHEAPGFAGAEKIGPDLTLVAPKVRGAWLREFLQDPARYSPESRMPDFKLSEAQAEAIAAYLTSLSAGKEMPPGGIGGAGPGNPVRGRKLVAETGCATCHTIKDLADEGFVAAAKTGPDLSGVGRKLRPEWLAGYLKDPGAYQPGTRMPRYRFRDDQVRDVAAYLMGLGEPSALPSPAGRKSAGEGEGEGKIAEGKKLVASFNCAGCHAIEGMKQGEMGPSLAGIGGKNPGRLDFGKNPKAIERTLPAWLMAKITDPRGFRDTLKMPLQKISPEDAEALVTLLLSFTKERVPAGYEARGGPAPDRVRVAGEAGRLFRELQCLGCHTLGGAGTNIGPNLTHVGSRVRADWLVKFLKDPGVLRPVLKARMPRLGVSDREAKLLADYAATFLVAEGEEGIDAPPKPLSAEEEARAKRLFGRKYGCQTCHRLGERGGRVGPDLTPARERLRRPWLVRYLKNPRAAVSEARMPNFDLPDGEAELLADYLLTFEAPPAARDQANATPTPRGEVRAAAPSGPWVSAGGPGQAGTLEQFRRGRYLYEYYYCGACHGENGKGDGYNAQYLPQFPRDYSDAAYMAAKTDEELFDGIKGGGRSVGLSALFPAYGKTLSDREIRDLVAYIRSFAQAAGSPPSAGRAPAGAKGGER